KVENDNNKKVKQVLKNHHLNSGISQLMFFVNEGYKVDAIPNPFVEGFVKLLYPVAPHLGEELWSILGHDDTITYEPWPEHDESKLVETEVEVVIQVMGKVRSK